MFESIECLSSMEGVGVWHSQNFKSVGRAWKVWGYGTVRTLRV